MTSFSLNIESGDAAMDSTEGAQQEIARLLRTVATKIDQGHEGGLLHDSNGNRCGSWSFDAPEPEDDDDAE